MTEAQEVGKSVDTYGVTQDQCVGQPTPSSYQALRVKALNKAGRKALGHCLLRIRMHADSLLLDWFGSVLLAMRGAEDMKQA